MEGEHSTRDVEGAEFARVLRDAQKSSWATWMVDDASKAAGETRRFLVTCFSHVRSDRQARLLKDLRAGDQDQTDSLICELVAHELLWRLKLQPEWHPTINKQNPDLGFQACGRRFVGDARLAHRLERAIQRTKPEPEGRPLVMSWDDPGTAGESRARKLADNIAGKAAKYASLGVPLVVFVFLDDDYLLDVRKVEKALYGMTLDDVQDEARFPYHIEHPDPFGGMLLPDAEMSFPHPNLAAVVVCDWFHTLNPADRGRRLHCVVLHGLAPSCMLPSDAFAPFGQVQWRVIGDTRLVPYCTGDLSTVAKFLESGALETRPYCADAPW